MTKTFQALTEQLRHPDHNLRSQAVFALEQLPDDAKIDALLQALTVEANFFVREDIVWALVRIGDAVVHPLMALLDDAAPSVRHQAAHTLSKIGDPRAVTALLVALHDHEPAVC